MNTKSEGRRLTAGEIALAKKIFGGSIDYKSVHIYNKKYIPFQPKNSGMTPNGNIYISGIYRQDYSSAVDTLQGFFVHEMAHVYQYQLHILKPLGAAISEFFKHGFNYTKAYEYTLDKNKDLLDYDLEQQAQIIEDYFRINYLKLQPIAGFLQNKVIDVSRGQLYEKVLARFLKNQSYARHIRECKWEKYGKMRRKTCRAVLTK